MLTFLILWLICCFIVAALNARFFTLFPDREDKQYREDKSQNISPINPIEQDNWHLVKVFVFIGILLLVIVAIYNAL